eukprot:3003727-Alexandrium_andersonii.AAC.1
MAETASGANSTRSRSLHAALPTAPAAAGRSAGRFLATAGPRTACVWRAAALPPSTQTWPMPLCHTL